MKNFVTTTTFVITNLIKLSGLVLGVRTGLTTGDTPTMLLAAFMMAGAQVSETLILGIFERFLGSPKPTPVPEDSS